MHGNYNDLPMSQKSKDDISFSVGDQDFLKKCFDRQDDVIKQYIEDTYDKHAEIICGVVREMIAEQNSAIFTKIDDQNKIIKEIQQLVVGIIDELRDHETRIKILEAKIQKIFLEHSAIHDK
jgi:hypothetical protein